MCTDTVARGGASVAAPQPPAGLWHDLEPATTFILDPVDSVELTTLVDNVVLPPDEGPAARPPPSGGPRRDSTTMAEGWGPDALVAQHGYSLLVTVTKGEVSHSVLFDTGITPDGAVDNMRRLGVDPSSIEAVVCSHGHYDHTGGLDGLARVLGPRRLPVVLHPHFWRRRRVVAPGSERRELPTTSRRALADAGFEVVEDPYPSFLLAGSVLVTGEVARTTGYEPGFPGQEAWTGSTWEPDRMVLDDQALVVDVRGKGLVVVTGCGHAGVVNVCRWARRLTGERPLHAVVGGFHLGGAAFEPLIPQVLDGLGGLGPQLVMAGHCTGWRAQHALAGRFGDAYVASSVGARLAV
ncbi:MAG: MBL fold metallo-hydrolase [Acidimicrobiales bacterium]